MTDSIVLDDADLAFSFTRSSGPGGQHVNTTDSAVLLRFNVQTCSALPEPVRRRLIALAGNRIAADGTLLITAQVHRSRQRNIEAAMARLRDLLRAASVRPKARRPTKPSAASKERRIAGKKERSAIKRGRRGVLDD